MAAMFKARDITISGLVGHETGNSYPWPWSNLEWNFNVVRHKEHHDWL